MLLLVAISALAAESDPTRSAFVDAIERMAAATAELDDATYTFHQQEVVGGVPQPAYVIEVEYRRPHDIHMTWVGDAATGRELLYRDGWETMQVDPGPWLPVVSLDPRGGLARRGQRHTIDNVGFAAVVPLFAADAERIVSRPELPVSFSDLGAATLYGEAAHCWRADLPRDREPAFYADRVEVCLSDRTRLPARIRAYEKDGDGAFVMVEAYGFEDVQVDVGLTDATFDPATYGW